MDDQLGNEPKLADPGAGLSLIEMFVLNYIIKPFFMQHMSRKRALKKLMDGSDEISELILVFQSDDLLKRILVKRPYFVEDSSRYWSAAMLCNHLGKVNGALAKAVENGFTAVAGNDYTPQNRLKAVKPDVEKNVIQEIDVFHLSVERIQNAARKVPDCDLKIRSIPHPWFGNLSHMQWIWFAGFHMRIHARQLRQIILALE